jgi:peptide/nickel transport system permease protein
MIISMLGSGIINVIVAIGIWSVPTYARLTRGSVLGLKSKEFVEGARTVGAGHLRIITRYLLANSLGPLIVFSTLHIATAILTVSALGFLGLGIAPPTPEWGSMVATGREYIRRAPHLIYIPGLVIFFTVMAFNSLGDTLQDALDPQGAGRDAG